MDVPGCGGLSVLGMGAGVIEVMEGESMRREDRNWEQLEGVGERKLWSDCIRELKKLI